MFQSITSFFYIILYQPLFNSLVWLYNSAPGHDFGIAIILLTIIIKAILYPTSVKAVKSQRGLQKLQPQLLELQKKYKDDKEKQAKEIFDLYKREKINPFSGLFLALIQIPILIALYQVFWNGLKVGELTKVLYSFVLNPGQINPMFLQLIDLSKPNMWLAVLAGIVQYIQTKMLLPQMAAPTTGKDKVPDFSQVMQKQMVYIFPVMTVVILISLPSALGLYWIISGVFSIIQQYYILKKSKVEITKV